MIFSTISLWEKFSVFNAINSKVNSPIWLELELRDLMPIQVICKFLNGPIKIKQASVHTRSTRAVRGSDYSFAIVRSEEKDKLLTRNWRGRRKSNNGMNKYEQPDSSIHDTLTHSSFLY